MQNGVANWFIKCGGVAATLLAVCGLATVWFGTTLQLPATTTRDGTLITMNRYLREPIPDVVLVGSSLTFRLKEEYFSTQRVRNLALAGGSPVTGLKIVVNQPHLPKLILVETNVLSRPTDDALVERFSRDSRADPLFLRPVRAAVAAYENWNHAARSHADVIAELDHLLAQPASNFDSDIYIERVLQEMNSDPSDAVRINAASIENLIALSEQRGAHVLLFELPLPAKVALSRSVVVTRDIMHAAFPDQDRWLQLDYPYAELRWPDGFHLDERSAVIVVRAIDRALAGRGP